MTVKLKACRLKHRDPSEKLKEEQFIIDDDDGMICSMCVWRSFTRVFVDPLPDFVHLGNSTRFTAKSVGEAMEWVVAIKEAMRVLEEREREEVRSHPAIRPSLPLCRVPN